MTFLFDPSFWGSISDWCLTLITGVTAYYLFRTLKSQKEVQRTQTELFKIESIRFRESIKPKLTYKRRGTGYFTEENHGRIIVIEIINETDSIALNIKSELSGKGEVEQMLMPLDIQRNHLSKGEDPILLNFLCKTGPLSFFVFLASYEDIAGTKYSQGVFCTDDNHSTDIHAFLPEIIN